MHPVSIVLAIVASKTVVKYAGFNATDAEAEFTKARSDPKNAELCLIQNAYPRLVCYPASEADEAKRSAEESAKREKEQQAEKENAAKRKVEELRAQLKEAEEAAK